MLVDLVESNHSLFGAQGWSEAKHLRDDVIPMAAATLRGSTSQGAGL